MFACEAKGVSIPVKAWDLLGFRDSSRNPVRSKRRVAEVTP